MAKKRDVRGQIPRMCDLSIAEQDELMHRWRLRKDLRALRPEIVEAMLQWVIDSADIEAFVAGGHLGLLHIIPNRDLLVRMLANGFTAQEVEAAIDQDETPLNWMASEVLAAVVERIALMKAYFATHDPGTFAQALAMYQVLGEAARRHFIQRYGYDPEQSSIPRVRITGEKSEQKKLKPEDHQPKLLS